MRQASLAPGSAVFTPHGRSPQEESSLRGPRCAWNNLFLGKFPGTWFTVSLLLCLSGCSKPVAYLTLTGTLTLPVNLPLAFQGAPISIVALAGNLARAGATMAEQTASASGPQPATGTYTVRLDASTLPATPTLFVVQLANPEPAPRSGALLEAIVALSRPAGKGPDLGLVTTDLDATSSVAAMALEYRESLRPDVPPTIDPLKVAAYLGSQTTLPFDFQQAFQAFVLGQTSTAPTDVLTLAQSASGALPQDLATLTGS